MIFFYNIFIWLYQTGIRIAASRNKKAAEWINGRKHQLEELEKSIHPNDQIIWMHCASAGEFEQGKPIIEALKNHYPDYKILVSFFSPSGFGIAKKYPHIDFISYLPADTKKNADAFLSIVKPSLVIFIKYEFWYHHLSAIAEKRIPLLLVSAIFRRQQIFFKWYGKFYKRMLSFFTEIFVQDKSSLDLLKSFHIDHCLLSGDTRFDRVKNITEHFTPLQRIREFVASHKTIVAGSTWPDDEKLLHEVKIQKKIKLILVPHEIDEAHLRQIENLFPDSIRYSLFEKTRDQERSVLIIDNIGMLSKLYHDASFAYIGGGFNKSGIHNTLEAAVYGKPVFFGPNYQKFREARELIESGAAFSISNAEELKKKIDHFLHDAGALSVASEAAKNYVERNTGATVVVMKYIQEKRLLTS